MDKVRINQGRIVPFQFRIGGTAIVLSLMATALLNLSEIPAIVLCIVLSLLIPPLWSSFYILEIDPTTKQILEIQWIVNWKRVEKTDYEAIEKIFINRTLQKQQMTSWGGQVRTSKVREYVSYLKLTSGEKFFLLSSTKPERLLKKLEPVQKKLQCEVVQNY